MDKKEKRMAHQKQRGNLVWGTILVILGLIFLLENLGYDLWEYVGKLWPVILIIWGLSKLQAALKTRDQEKTTPPTEEKPTQL